MIDILNGKGPSNDIYGIKDSLDGIWIGGADRPLIYQDIIKNGILLSAESRAKASSLIMKVQLNRLFEYLPYDGGSWKNEIQSNDG